jgi:GNAT superfamily N-acetyltransferase
MKRWRIALTASIAWASVAAAAGSPIFLNGKGLNVPSAVLGKRANPKSPSVYQFMEGRFSPELTTKVTRAGFGFVRVVTTPVPLMTDDPAARERAVAWLSSIVDSYHGAGLGVIIDLHLWSSDAPLHQDNVVADPLQRAALMRAQAAAARMLASRKGGRVALELINEPPCEVRAKPFDWAAVQRAMVANVRRVAPRLPLVLTGCRGRPERLTRLDATPYRSDPNIFWTIHYYEPSAFVFQDDKGLRRVPFPPDPTIAGTSATARMLPPSAVHNRRWLTKHLDEYLRGNRGQATIAQDMAAVADWARRQGIATCRIFVGEFGTMLTPANVAGIEADNWRWYSAVRQEAERQGFAWALWAWPQPGNISYDPASGFLRPEMLKALGFEEPRERVGDGPRR